MNKIFISYRRADTQDIAGRIFDHLAFCFGEENLFKDVISIKLGVNFHQEILDFISKCDVVLVLIGKNWLDVDVNGKRRIDTKDDYVRVEIETAIDKNKTIIPILINDAVVPNQKDLPKSIEKISFINAVKIRPNPDFTNDFRNMVLALEMLGFNPIKNEKNYLRIEDVASLLSDFNHIAKYLYETVSKSEVESFFLSVQNFHVSRRLTSNVDVNIFHGTDYLMRVLANDPLIKNRYNKNNLGAAFRCYADYAIRKGILQSKLLPDDSDTLNNKEVLSIIIDIFETAKESRVDSDVENKLRDLTLSMSRYLFNVARKNEVLDYSARDVSLVTEYINAIIKKNFSFRLPESTEDLTDFRIYCQH